METNTKKEVVIEFFGTTTETRNRKVKIRFEDDIDFENPSEELKDLLFGEFLGNYQIKEMKILHDENLSDYDFQKPQYSVGVDKEPSNDHFVYMENGYRYENDHYWEGYELQPKIGRWSHLSCWGIKSIMSVCQIPTEKYFSMSNGTPYFDEYSLTEFDDIWFTKDKDEIREMWKNKEYKSLVESSHGKYTEHRFRKYHKLFEKGISTKKQKEEGGVIIGILNDVDDYRKEYCTWENSILIGKILLDK